MVKVKEIKELREKTEKIFFKDEGYNPYKVPEPPHSFKDKIEALEKANLMKQRAACIFDMRCWQAENMGFKKVSFADLCILITGETFTESKDLEEKHVCEWVYNHHTDQDLTKENWSSSPSLIKRVVRDGLWHLPPFSKATKWTLKFGKLDYLKKEIPYGVSLLINECKQLKLFNGFGVIAPLEAWERKTEIDPIVVASVWEFPPNEKGEYKNGGQQQHFFLAQWQ